MEEFLSKDEVDNKKKFCMLLWQFVKFGIVGFSNTAISLLVYYIFILIDNNLYMWGSIVGFIISVVNAFFWSNKFVFENKDNTVKTILKRLLKTYMTYGATFILTTFLLFIQINYLNLSEWIAPIINLIITIPLNFILNKFWAMK